MEVVVTTGAVRHAQLQSKYQTNTQFFTGWMPLLSLNQQCQSNEGKQVCTDYVYNTCMQLTTGCISDYRMMANMANVFTQLRVCFTMPVNALSWIVHHTIIFMHVILLTAFSVDYTDKNYKSYFTMHQRKMDWKLWQNIYSLVITEKITYKDILSSYLLEITAVN